MSQIDPNKKKQLDANIREMLKKGASQEDVIRYANDFNNKFALKKKRPRGNSFGWRINTKRGNFFIGWRRGKAGSAIGFFFWRN